ncbi:hypothetical protein AB0028_25375, partial [Klebsiella pneumoniae]
NPEVPVVISQVVQRLLTKAPEGRYQSASGLARDLEYTREYLDQNEPKTFVPGRSDHVNRLSIPHKLYGRASEQKQLRAAFDRMEAEKSMQFALVG